MRDRSTQNPVAPAPPGGERTPRPAGGGTPPEIVRAFDRFCAGGADSLSPHLFFQLVEQAPIALSITDESATILYANHSFEELTGYPRDQVLGRNESILSSRATPRSWYRDLWRTIGGKRTWTGRLVNRRRDGGDYLAELTIAPVLDGADRITHYLGMHRDVTRAHELQRQVEHQKGLLETILDTAPVVVALLDEQRRILLDNQEYKKLFGDLRGAEPAEVLLDAVAEQTGGSLPRPVVPGDDFRNVEVRLELAGAGPRWFSCSATWLEAPQGSATDLLEPSRRQSVCLLLASETTRQRREHERARVEHLRAGLAEQQRIRGMREALAAAAFQIQQPLNLVKAATAMLRRGGEASDELLEALAQIGDSSQRAYEALLATVPSEAEEPLQPLNLNEILQQVLEMATDALLKAGVRVVWQPTAVLSSFCGRAKQVRGMLMDVVDNAIVAVSEGRAARRELIIRTEEARGVLTVTVQDDGPGIPPSERLAVLQPLYCGWRNKTGHAGLGLAIAQEIASQHGGGIQIDDEVDRGCRVRIELPVKR